MSPRVTGADNWSFAYHLHDDEGDAVQSIDQDRQMEKELLRGMFT